MLRMYVHPYPSHSDPHGMYRQCNRHRATATYVHNNIFRYGSTQHPGGHVNTVKRWSTTYDIRTQVLRANIRPYLRASYVDVAPHAHRTHKVFEWSIIPRPSKQYARVRRFTARTDVFRSTCIPHTYTLFAGGQACYPIEAIRTECERMYVRTCLAKGTSRTATSPFGTWPLSPA
jgi:hypothetical protein